MSRPFEIGDRVVEHDDKELTVLRVRGYHDNAPDCTLVRLGYEDTQRFSPDSGLMMSTKWLIRAPKFKVGQAVVHANDPSVCGRVQSADYGSHTKTWFYNVPGFGSGVSEDNLQAFDGQTSSSPLKEGKDTADWKVGDMFKTTKKSDCVLTVSEIKTEVRVKHTHPSGNVAWFRTGSLHRLTADEIKAEKDKKAKQAEKEVEEALAVLFAAQKKLAELRSENKE